LTPFQPNLRVYFETAASLDDRRISEFVKVAEASGNLAAAVTSSCS
jgi:hypothetical protein